MENVLYPNKVAKCGGTMLFEYDCPKCGQTLFTGLKHKFCDYCKTDLGEWYIDTSKAFFKNVVAIYDDKRRKIISKVMVRKMFSEQEGCCAYCRKDITGEYHVEHIVPLSGGGSNERDNLCLSCPPCNLVAGSKIFESFWDKTEYILRKRRIF